jgi:hypothetical protein
MKERDELGLAEDLWRAVVSGMCNDGSADDLYRLLNRRDKMSTEVRNAVDDVLTALTGMGAVELLNRAEELEDDALPSAVVDNEEDSELLDF